MPGQTGVFAEVVPKGLENGALDATHFFLYAAIGIATCFVVGYLVSLALPARPKDLSELTLFTLAAEETAEQE